MLKSTLTALLSSVTLAIAPAFGHAKLERSSPADHARLASPPPTLTLTFSERAQLAMLHVKGSAQEIPVSFDRQAKSATTIVIALPALAPDTYEVQWTALAADDGHLTKGSFTFTVSGAKAS